MTKQNEETVVCLIDGANGIYIPQLFARQYAGGWSGADLEDLETVAGGVDTPGYWEAWDTIVDSAVFTDSHGVKWHLWPDGDLFIYSDDGEVFV